MTGLPMLAGYGTSLHAGSIFIEYGKFFWPFRYDTSLWTKVVLPEPAIPNTIRHTGLWSLTPDSELDELLSFEAIVLITFGSTKYK